MAKKEGATPHRQLLLLTKLNSCMRKSSYLVHVQRDALEGGYGERLALLLQVLLDGQFGILDVLLLQEGVLFEILLEGALGDAVEQILGLTGLT